MTESSLFTLTSSDMSVMVLDQLTLRVSLVICLRRCVRACVRACVPACVRACVIPFSYWYGCIGVMVIGIISKAVERGSDKPDTCNLLMKTNEVIVCYQVAARLPAVQQRG